MYNEFITAEMVFFKFLKVSLLHAYSSLEIPKLAARYRMLLFTTDSAQGKGAELGG